MLFLLLFCVKIYQKVVFKAKIEQYKNLEKTVETSPKHLQGRSFASSLVLGVSRFIYSQANNAKRIYPETPELVPGALTAHLQCAALWVPSSLAALGTRCRGCVSPSNSGLRAWWRVTLQSVSLSQTRPSKSSPPKTQKERF